MSNGSNTMTAALLAAACAGPLLAEPNIAPHATVTVDIEVEEIAVFELIENPELLVVTDPERAQLGTTPFDVPEEMAQFLLRSNFCPASVDFEFDTVTDIRGGDGRHYGAAKRDGTTLGTLPFVRSGGTLQSFGDPTDVAGSADPAPLAFSLSAATNCNGERDFFVGAVTRWDLTREGEPEFAAPGVYVLPVTATISGSS